MCQGNERTTKSARDVIEVEERASRQHGGPASDRADRSTPAMATRSDEASAAERRLSQELNHDFDEQSAKVTLTLNDVERARLLILLERELHDTHMEARRTEDPNYQDEVHQQEAFLKCLIEKLRQV
jgi:hypothetical protein